MTGFYEQMCSVLRPLNLYSLTGATLVDAELRAYAAGLALLGGRFDTILRDFFLESAGEEGLARYEKLYGFFPGARTLGQRRDRLHKAARHMQGVWSRTSFLDTVRETGFFGELEEFPAENRVHLRFAGQAGLMDSRAVLAALYDVLPAQLKCTADIPAPDWNAIEAFGNSCDVWDRLGARWELQEIEGGIKYGQQQ